VLIVACLRKLLGTLNYDGQNQNQLAAAPRRRHFRQFHPLKSNTGASPRWIV